MAIPIIDDIFTFFQNIISWFVHSAPDWAKIVFSTFLVIFVINLVMPIFLGLVVSCDTDGNLYKNENFINGVQIIFTRLSVGNGFVNNTNVTNFTLSDLINRTPDQKSFADWFNRFYLPCEFNVTTNACPDVYYCCQFSENPGYIATPGTKVVPSLLEYYNPEVYFKSPIVEYNQMVHSQGTLWKPTDNDIVFPICKGTTPRLSLFGKLDIFDPTTWIIITIATIIIPLAFAWYKAVGL